MDFISSGMNFWSRKIFDSNVAHQIFQPSNLVGASLSIATALMGKQLMDVLIQQDPENDPVVKKYPYMKYNTDVAYLIQNILHFKPYAHEQVTRACDLTNRFLKHYHDFTEVKTSEKLQVVIKQLHDYITDAVDALQDIQTRMCQTKPKHVEVLETYTMELEQCLQQLYQNIMMDYQIKMDNFAMNMGYNEWDDEWDDDYYDSLGCSSEYEDTESF